MARPHYPRMMYHRSKPPVTVHSWAEEYALGAEWRRTVWPQGGDYPAAIPAPGLSTVSAVPETDAAPGGSGDDPPGAPHPTISMETFAERYLKPDPPAPPKRQRAPTVKPTGKPKKKSRDW